MGAGRESSRREHIAYVYRAVTAAPMHSFYSRLFDSMLGGPFPLKSTLI